MLTSMIQVRSRVKHQFVRVAVITLGVGSLVGGITVVAGVAPAGAVVTTRYVSPSGSDVANSCTVKASPCQTLKHANNVSGSGDTVQLAPGTFVGNIVITHDLTIKGSLPTGSLDATNNTINGEGNKGGAITITITGKATVSMSNLVINGAFNIVGGIYIDGGALSLTNVTVENNVAEYGAGIFNDGELFMSGELISGNSAVDGGYGGGLFNEGLAELHSVAFNHDVASGIDSEGGAIFNEGDLQLTGTTPIHNNSATFDGGGIEKCTGSGNSFGPGTTVTANTPNNIGTAC